MSFGPRNLVTLILVLLVPAVVFGEVPDINNCDISTRATEDVSVMICPACDGYAFSAAQTLGGDVTMDATIEVYIRNNAGQPLDGISAGDIWLDDANLFFCADGNIADFDTDTNGYTEFDMPICGGGCTQDFALGGYLAGTPFNENPLPFLQFNSSDANGDLVVDLIDLSGFTQAYYADPPAAYCFDYYWDNIMDLRDLALFAQHYGHECAN
jgi:hypothetical protein